MSTKTRKAKRGKSRRKHAKKAFAAQPKPKIVLPLRKGDRVRSIVEYRKGMEGRVKKIDGDVAIVDIESSANGKPCIVECQFDLPELERVA